MITNKIERGCFVEEDEVNDTEDGRAKKNHVPPGGTRIVVLTYPVVFVISQILLVVIHCVLVVIHRGETPSVNPKVYHLHQTQLTPPDTHLRHRYTAARELRSRHAVASRPTPGWR